MKTFDGPQDRGAVHPLLHNPSLSLRCNLISTFGFWIRIVFWTIYASINSSGINEAKIGMQGQDKIDEIVIP